MVTSFITVFKLFTQQILLLLTSLKAYKQLSSVKSQRMLHLLA